jgi:rRNA-processing protein FCF1
MLPRPGTPIDNIASRLRQLVDTVYQAPEPIDYALWVTSAEASLRECFIDVPFERLLSERFWRLTTGSVMRPHEMLRAEQQVQYQWLEYIRTTTGAMAERFGKPAAPIGVLDTHVVMHAKPLEEIDWCARLGAKSVRLVVPLRVVDELDEKKYARRDDLRNNARKRLRLLARYLEEPDGIADGVRIEIVGWRDLDPGGVPRPPLPADVDILDTCDALRVYATGNAVSMITADVGMTLRARERGLPVVALDDHEMQAGQIPD